VEVSEEMITQAYIRGDIAQLHLWARRGVRVHSADPLCQGVGFGRFDIVRWLVKEPGADVYEADEQGYTPLCIAVQMNDINMTRCLVQ
jgi:ankyrin repeat protein